MLFGRLRVPVEKGFMPEPRSRHESGLHLLGDEARDAARGDAPHPSEHASARASARPSDRPVSTHLSLVRPGMERTPTPATIDEFAGLDRLDREELDEL
jgi:hypothetical protein